MKYEISRGTIVYNGIKIKDYGVWAKGGGMYSAPARRYTPLTVPGRNGVLTIDEGAFEEVEHEYPCFIAEDFPVNIQGLRNALLASPGYHTLTDDYNPDEFYNARYMDGLEVDVAPRAIAGSFTLRFRRDPRRFLKDGAVARVVTNGGELLNPTLYPAKPMIRVTGYGELYIGSQRIAISSGFPYVDIDSETMECFYGTQSAGTKVVLGADFPELSAGTTGITWNGSITGVTITPRWWRI